MVAVCRATEGVSSAVDSCYKYMIIIVNCIIVLVLYEYFPRVRALGITRSVFVLLHAQAIGVYPAQLILYHFVQMCHSSEARSCGLSQACRDRPCVSMLLPSRKAIDATNGGVLLCPICDSIYICHSYFRKHGCTLVVEF